MPEQPPQLSNFLSTPNNTSSSSSMGEAAGVGANWPPRVQRRHWERNPRYAAEGREMQRQTMRIDRSVEGREVSARSSRHYIALPSHLLPSPPSQRSPLPPFPMKFHSIT
eukprot:760119-Hanusia_phi.AAC.3